jgi:hypothetical protein
MKSYKSDYENQVLQVLIAPSQHLFYQKNGQLHYQKKKLDLCIEKAIDDEREILVYYTIRDHFSGRTIADVTTNRNLWKPETWIIPLIAMLKPEIVLTCKFALNEQVQTFLTQEGICFEVTGGFKLYPKTITNCDSEICCALNITPWNFKIDPKDDIRTISNLLRDRISQLTMDSKTNSKRIEENRNKRGM